MKNNIPNSIYGPVQSWRLGKSLGVDVLCIDSICSFECVYCQLGKINLVTGKRDIFVSTKKVLSDLQKADWQPADVITFSGSGEPTLAKNLGILIKKIKDLTGKPIIVLTNSTTLIDEKVRKELALADKIFCKLDAWSNDSLRRINRPINGATLENITGIRHLRNEFNGFLAIQTMILGKLNEFEIEELAEIYHSIKPDEIQLNLPARPIPTCFLVESRGNEIKPDQTFRHLKPISKADLEKIRLKLSKLTKLRIVVR
jgi:wyosine [tRNA(Phe)-imidazoG37] synthetase (radical SAM superfamily)